MWHETEVLFTFQQANDLRDTTKATLEWLQDKSLTVPEWPSKTPCLNPIDHMWRDLKMAVHRLLLSASNQTNPVSQRIS